MHKEHLIFCGGVPLERRRGAEVHELRLGKDEKQRQIRLRAANPKQPLYML